MNRFCFSRWFSRSSVMLALICCLSNATVFAEEDDQVKAIRVVWVDTPERSGNSQGMSVPSATIDFPSAFSQPPLPNDQRIRPERTRTSPFSLSVIPNFASFESPLRRASGGGLAGTLWYRPGSRASVFFDGSVSVLEGGSAGTISIGGLFETAAQLPVTFGACIDCVGATGGPLLGREGNGDRQGVFVSRWRVAASAELLGIDDPISLVAGGSLSSDQVVIDEVVGFGVGFVTVDRDVFAVEFPTEIIARWSVPITGGLRGVVASGLQDSPDNFVYGAGLSLNLTSTDVAFVEFNGRDDGAHGVFAGISMSTSPIQADPLSRIFQQVNAPESLANSLGGNFLENLITDLVVP